MTREGKLLEEEVGVEAMAPAKLPENATAARRDGTPLGKVPGKSWPLEEAAGTDVGVQAAASCKLAGVEAAAAAELSQDATAALRDGRPVGGREITAA